MSAERRCPSCGALVVGDARWCGQCYAPLGGAAAEEAPAPEASDDAGLGIDIGEIDWSELDASGVARAPAAPAPAGTPGAESAVTAAGATRVSIRRVGETLLWACPQCELDNPMEAAACARCGTPFSSLLATEAAAERDVPPPSTILWSALVMPGLGHIRLGRAAEGIARLILFLWAAGLGLMMLLSLGGGDAGPATATPTPATPAASGSPGAIVAVGALFIATAVAIWGVSAMDAMRLARGDENQILRPRVLLVGTIVLTVLSIGAFVAAGISTTPAAP